MCVHNRKNKNKYFLLNLVVLLEKLAAIKLIFNFRTTIGFSVLKFKFNEQKRIKKNFTNFDLKFKRKNIEIQFDFPVKTV